MAYESFLIEVPDLNEALQEVNESGRQIVSVVHISESQQLLLIVEDEERRSVLQPISKRKELEDEED